MTLMRYFNYMKTNIGDAQEVNAFIGQLMDKNQSLETYPHSYPNFQSSRKLKYEYRKLIFKNYIILYAVNELEHTVNVYRILYAGRSYLYL